jgi:hypothetical protein
LILGIIASSISGSKVVTSSYESIATTTVGSGGASSVSFSSIPSTYAHLQIRILGRGSYTYSNLLDGTINFNSDTTVSNYYSHTLKGNGTAASASAEASCYLKNVFPGANQTASVFGGYVIDILDYADTNKYKTVRYLGGVDVNGSGQLNLGSNLWKNTSAISSIQLFVDGNWTQYTSIALYGIKA